MRYPKFLLNAFATLGVFAFIFLACSVAEDVVNDDTVVVVDDENPPIENNYGKYQIAIATITNSGTSYTTILNTETGEVKTYALSVTNPDGYILRATQNLGGF